MEVKAIKESDIMCLEVLVRLQRIVWAFFLYTKIQKIIIIKEWEQDTMQKLLSNNLDKKIVYWIYVYTFELKLLNRVF